MISACQWFADLVISDPVLRPSRPRAGGWRLGTMSNFDSNWLLTCPSSLSELIDLISDSTERSESRYERAWYYRLVRYS